MGPATEATVRALVSVEDAREDKMLVAVINAVNFRVQAYRIVKEYVNGLADPIPENTVWPADIAYGCDLLAARLFSRRNSPEGVADFTAGADGGAVYIQRNDPDIAQLLRLGAHRQLTVG